MDDRISHPCITTLRYAFQFADETLPRDRLLPRWEFTRPIAPHAHDILYRDLKLENIWCDRQ